MSFVSAISEPGPMLAGGSMYERMRRHASVSKDPDIAHAALLYDDDGRTILERTHGEYVDVALRAGLPMLVMAGTWRANRERIARSRFSEQRVNEDYVEMLRGLCDEATREREGQLFVGGVLGPKGDAYAPQEAPSEEDALRFHSHQAEILAATDVDVLLAMTLPALGEARGIARAFASTGKPWILSFVVRDTGTLLDGTPLDDAIAALDDAADSPAVGYFLNCVHPSVAARALEASAPSAVARIIGLKANTSARSPEELDGSAELIAEDPETLAESMREVRDRFGIEVLAGCCGTSTEHVEQIAARCAGVAND